MNSLARRMPALTLSNTAITIGLLGAGAYATRQLYTSRPLALDSTSKLGAGTPPPKKTFTSPVPVNFKSLRLESVEHVNHNTKKLRFELPDRDAVSGLGLTCTSPPPRPGMFCEGGVLTALQPRSCHTTGSPARGSPPSGPTRLSAT